MRRTAAVVRHLRPVVDQIWLQRLHRALPGSDPATALAHAARTPLVLKAAAQKEKRSQLRLIAAERFDPKRRISAIRTQVFATPLKRRNLGYSPQYSASARLRKCVRRYCGYGTSSGEVQLRRPRIVEDRAPQRGPGSTILEQPFAPSNDERVPRLHGTCRLPQQSRHEGNRRFVRSQQTRTTLFFSVGMRDAYKRAVAEPLGILLSGRGEIDLGIRINTECVPRPKALSAG